MSADDTRRRNSKPLYPQNNQQGSITRRGFLSGVGAVTGAAALGMPTLEAQSAPASRDTAPAVPVRLMVNGQQHQLNLDPRVTLLDLLREELGLTGTKKGCDHGQCGACTVLANGRRINSCLSLAASHDGEEIITVEGLAHGAELHPIQTAFIEHDGFQCGYCTPGQLCSAVAMMEEYRKGDASFVTPNVSASGPVKLTDEEIRERMSGNICRCGAYPGIVAAVRQASGVPNPAAAKEEKRG